MHKLEIDIVYLWVDGNDPNWLRRKLQLTGNFNENSEQNCKGRYINNNELMYSLRALEKNAPWIRKVFIVTDNQIPEWLNTENARVQIVDHTQILAKEALPCYNSSVIEYYLHNIPGLSEYFLFSNDDMFINKPVSPESFFNENGLPYIRLKRKVFGRWHHHFKTLIGQNIGHYRKMLIASSELVYKITGKYFSGIPHHNIDAYRKSMYKECVENVFNKEVKRSCINHVRTDGDLHRSAFSYYVLAKKEGILCYVYRKTSSRLLAYRHDLNKYIARYNPYFFCLNDNQKMKDSHRKLIKPFLEKLYPEKSAFEK